MMIKDAKEGIDAIDRRCFIARAKGTYADRLQLAFSRADKDNSGASSSHPLRTMGRHYHLMGPSECPVC